MTNLILNTLNSLQQSKSKTKYWNITWDQGVFISNLIEINKPRNILEIGTSNGFSTLWLCKCLCDDAKITTIEVNQDRFNEAKKSFKRCKLENIKQINANVFEYLSNLNVEERFDFVFIDAEQEHYLEILELLEKQDLIMKKSIIVFDNILNHDSTKGFALKIDSKKYDKEIIDLGSGMLILFRK